MSITIFRNINGRVVPLTVSEIAATESYLPRSRLPKFHLNPTFNNEYFKSVDAYTNPNAQCPVCGSLVFYYEHNNGSKVYFEELGPPWPKHPCTDNPSIYIKAPLLINNEQVSLHQNQSPSINNYLWYTEDWRPSKVLSSKEVVTGTGLPNSVELTLIASGEAERVKCTINYVKLRKLKLNINSIKKALFHTKLISNSNATISIHSGISHIEIVATVLPKKTNNVAIKNKVTLNDISLQIPNIDGNLTLLFAQMQMRRIMLVFDMNDRKHTDVLGRVIDKQTPSLSLSCDSNSKWGDSVHLLINDEPTIKLSLRPEYDSFKFLSPSQKAENISEKKQKYGGNSILADAFLKAFNNS